MKTILSSGIHLFSDLFPVAVVASVMHQQTDSAGRPNSFDQYLKYINENGYVKKDFVISFLFESITPFRNGENVLESDAATGDLMTLIDDLKLQSLKWVKNIFTSFTISRIGVRFYDSCVGLWTILSKTLVKGIEHGKSSN